jgi:transposase
VTAADGYHFDPDKVQYAINELKAARDKLDRDAFRRAQRLLGLRQPGPDRATTAFHQAMQQSHQRHYDELLAYRQQMQNQIDNLEAAMRQYHETEASNRQAFRQRGV